ncbi:hypothetical protein BAR24066_07368 [Burkholderia arboris]|uniref:Mobilization protein n=1 Tax=Burkholderia arboris TaxID=488730 RepID=A0A9Q9SRT0_9BURK|nr:mobilization protein [Burkholderia arboris]VWC46013.1 hypothetical protein BAR24066_07368 [Burkholderia arboris]
MARTKSDKLAELLKKQEQINQQIQALKQRESAEERKKDTRRKILLGGVVLAKVKRGDWPYQQLLDLIDGDLTADRDRALFDGLKPKESDAKKDNPGEPDGGNRQ